MRFSKEWEDDIRETEHEELVEMFIETVKELFELKHNRSDGEEWKNG